MRWFAAAALLVLPLLIGSGVRGQEPKTLTVCEVVQNLESLNGKQVAIRGVVFSNGHEHVLPREEEWASETRRHGYRFLNSVHLVSAASNKRDHRALEATRKQVLDAFGGKPYW
jgi:hypothetical protein